MAAWKVVNSVDYSAELLVATRVGSWVEWKVATKADWREQQWAVSMAAVMVDLKVEQWASLTAGYLAENLVAYLGGSWAALKVET